jgi:CheY-like chemotaxis protein
MEHAVLRMRHRGEGGLTVEPGRYEALIVEDEGSGIEESVRARNFEHYITTNTCGRGLALSAMLGILLSHRASIDVTSVPGQGTTFRVLIPEGTPPATVSVSTRPSSAQLTGVVLLADDEASVLDTTRCLLEGLGFAVVPASDGLRALEEAERMRHGFGLAVLDLSMPGMNGRELARALRLRRPELPIVLMSGFAGDDASSNLLDDRMFFLGKPFRRSDLQRVLEQALERAGQILRSP